MTWPNWGIGTLQYGIRATSSILDPYGPRASENLSKFIVADLGLYEFGGESGGNQSQIPKFVVMVHV